jgi:hypothetical protein
MECPICFEAITEDTGVVKMACKHSFHFCCLGTWFSHQFVNKQKESCPCCRHEAGEKERLPRVEISSSSLLWMEDRIGDDRVEIAVENVLINLTDSIINQTRRMFYNPEDEYSDIEDTESPRESYGT